MPTETYATFDFGKIRSTLKGKIEKKKVRIPWETWVNSHLAKILNQCNCLLKNITQSDILYKIKYVYILRRAGIIIGIDFFHCHE